MISPLGGRPDLSFRDAAEADVDALVGLIHSAYRGAESRRGWTTEADLLEGQRVDVPMLRDLLRSPGNLFLLAERAGRPVAQAHLQHQGPACHFGMFAVRPNCQAAGIGRALLTEAESTARSRWGCQEMYMEVIAQRPELIAWYERRGFTRTAETAAFPYGDPRFGLPLRDDLYFVRLRKRLSELKK